LRFSISSLNSRWEDRGLKRWWKTFWLQGKLQTYIIVIIIIIIIITKREALLSNRWTRVWKNMVRLSHRFPFQYDAWVSFHWLSQPRLLPLQGCENENTIQLIDDILNSKLIKLKDFFNLLNNFCYNIFLKIRF